MEMSIDQTTSTKLLRWLKGGLGEKIGYLGYIEEKRSQCVSLHGALLV